MKKIIFITFISVYTSVCFSQSNDIEVAALSAPSSPAFNLLGISPNSIDKPTDLTSLAASIQTAANNISSIPSKYAIELNPFQLFGKESMTVTALNNEKFNAVFKQSFVLSIGVSNELKDDSQKTKLTQTGFGIKFSIIRPKFNTKTDSIISKIQNIQSKAIELTNKNNLADKQIMVYDSIIKATIMNKDLPEDQKQKTLKLFGDLIVERKLEISKNTQKESDQNETEIKETTKNLKLNRSGFFLDFATGTVLDFEEQTFNRSSVSKAGAWLTASYDKGKTWNLLSIARYLYQPDKILADDTGLISTKNISTLDGGFKLIYKEQNHQKLSISTEALYRSVLDKNSINPSWRIVMNATYEVEKNKLLTFTFGKDFDNSIIKRDNLLASLNLIIGLGSNTNFNK